MSTEQNSRALAHIEKIAWVKPIDGADNIELVGVLGWQCIAKIGEFHEGDLCCYIEIDSKVPENNKAFSFLDSKGYKIKTMKLSKFSTYSQGIAIPIESLNGNGFSAQFCKDCVKKSDKMIGTDVTKMLGITYSVKEDNVRKASSKTASFESAVTSMKSRHQKFFKNKYIKNMMKYLWFRKFIFVFLGKKKDKPKGWPIGKFPGVGRTDQPRCENMPWILNDKTPFIVTQKCDGSSGTYILERIKNNKYEFYVCSRNVRMLNDSQECFYGNNNYYWEVAIKYDIESKMKDYLQKNPDVSFVCWQGEICAPGIQKNPHKLSETHLFCFHMTDSKNGRFDIRDAKQIWDYYGMETVPIVAEDYIMPDDMETFKTEADGYYDAVVCEGNSKCQCEGFVYYKTTDPSFSLKNVSRKYLLKHGQ